MTLVHYSCALLSSSGCRFLRIWIVGFILMVLVLQLQGIDHCSGNLFIVFLLLLCVSVNIALVQREAGYLVSLRYLYILFIKNLSIMACVPMTPTLLDI
jgi:hypothetical protein